MQYPQSLRSITEWGRGLGGRAASEYIGRRDLALDFLVGIDNPCPGNHSLIPEAVIDMAWPTPVALPMSWMAGPGYLI